LQGDVATNTSNISTNTSNISTIQGDVTTIQGDITTLQGEMDDKVDVSKIGNNVLTGLSEETTFSSRTTLIANNVDPSDGTTSSTYITLEL
jgi:hypothetical protein